MIFTPYSLIGDWPSIAIRETVKLGKCYTIEADGVHGDILRKRHISHVAWKRWVKRNVEFPAFDLNYRYNLRHSALAIFQGQDVYNAYARYCPRPVKLNHHVPVYAGDHISPDQLETKLVSAQQGDRLKIVYAGRAIDMKGPLEWMATLQHLNERGVKFEATWLGDGPMLDAMKAQNIPGVHMAGFVGDRNLMLTVLRGAHVFLFCHNTLESARILGEALACGAPLIGFRTDYPADLVSDHGGGLFSDMGDVNGLAEIVARLDKDRTKLADLIASAAASGREFDRDALLRKRVEMVKANRASGKRLQLKDEHFERPGPHRLGT
ncbi:glycosyltransferase family 4 protein [Sphingomonas piscis]|uniref:Glycosyltransferase family 4 protein n=1 Tax=Sphingomonas piscis TaxID=2714943 RepID=A0A6G7YQV9_9SPHN|nr:glycosyltransferase [Sphingomonas piscis]QIK79122.1 glycosyltransferase family 4 protein [Sphingomonas piscis]